MSANQCNAAGLARPLGFVTLIAITATMNGSAWAVPQDEPSAVPPPASESSIEFTFKPGVWLTRINGESTLGPVGTTLILEDDLNLDNHEAAFGAELAILKNDIWQIGISGFQFSTESEGAYVGTAQFGDLTINNGDAFAADFELTSIAADFGFWLCEPFTIGTQNDGRYSRLGMRIGPVIGVRHVDLDQSITIEGVGGQSADGEWLAPVAGVRLQMEYDTPDGFPIFDSILIDAAGVLGPALGGDGGTITHFHAGMTGFITRHIGIGMEYRLLHLDVEDDDFVFDGGLQGLFFFASLRF